MVSEADLTLIYNNEYSHFPKRALFIASDMNRFTSSSELGQYHFEISMRFEKGHLLLCSPFHSYIKCFSCTSLHSFLLLDILSSHLHSFSLDTLTFDSLRSIRSLFLFTFFVVLKSLLRVFIPVDDSCLSLKSYEHQATMYCQVPGFSAGRGPFQAKEQSRYGAGPSIPSMRNQIFTAGSQFAQGNHHQYHAHPQIQHQQQVHSPLPNQVNHRQLYGHQMEQFLNEQRKQIQQQMEQRMAVQRKIDQQNADKSEVSKVQAKLGNEACEIQNFPFKNMAVEQQPKEYGVVKITNVSPCISHFSSFFLQTLH